MRQCLLASLLTIAACVHGQPAEPPQPKPKPGTNPLKGCVLEDTTYKCPDGRVVTLFDVDRVHTDKAALLGKDVTVRGVLTAARGTCTLMACGRAAPCCNRCFRSLVLKSHRSDVSLRLQKQGRPLTCGGTNCDYQKVCAKQSGQTRTYVAKLIENQGKLTLVLRPGSEVAKARKIGYFKKAEWALNPVQTKALWPQLKHTKHNREEDKTFDDYQTPVDLAGFAATADFQYVEELLRSLHITSPNRKRADLLKIKQWIIATYGEPDHREIHRTGERMDWNGSDTTLWVTLTWPDAKGGQNGRANISYTDRAWYVMFKKSVVPIEPAR